MVVGLTIAALLSRTNRSATMMMGYQYLSSNKPGSEASSFPFPPTEFIGASLMFSFSDLHADNWATH